MYESSSIMLEEEMNTFSICPATWSVNVKGIIICSNPSNLLNITTLCFLFSKTPSFRIRNLALWKGLKAIGLSSDNEEALMISSGVAMKMDFLKLEFHLHRCQETQHSPRVGQGI